MTIIKKTKTGRLNSGLGVGPMSPEVVEAVFRYSNYHRKELMIIASKNQVDYNGGYVNRWSTVEFMRYINRMKEEYPNAVVYICRDHCGPGFNGIDDLKDTRKTIEADIENGFDLIHIDFCHFKGSKDQQLKESKKAIEYCLKLNPDIILEVGTDENAGTNYNLPNIEEIKKEIDFFKGFCDPEFFVVQTGSLVKEINQVGSYNKQFVQNIAEVLRENNMKLKEHNADYLSQEGVSLRSGMVDAMNIAPQLGVIQTKLTIQKCLTYGINFDDFLNEAYGGKKWKKWLHTNTPDNKFLCSVVAGHYHFSSESYKNIIKQLKGREDIQDSIISSVMDTIGCYEF